MRTFLSLALALMSVSAFASNDLNGTKVTCIAVSRKTLKSASNRDFDDNNADIKTLVLTGNRDHVSGDVTLAVSYDGKMKRKIWLDLERFYNENGGEYRVLKLTTPVKGIEVSTEGSDSSVNIRVGGTSDEGITCTVN